MSDTVKTLTLVEFLTARLDAETERQILRDREDFLIGVPTHRREEAAAAHDRLAWTQGERFAGALRVLGWTLTAMFFPRAARHRAVAFSDHEDYRDEWKP